MIIRQNTKTNFLQFIFLFFIPILVELFPVKSVADCLGCCSWHGGVVCRNGVTMCADDSSLSSTCINKSCNMCGSTPQPPSPPSLESNYVPIIYNITPSYLLPNRTLRIRGKYFGYSQGSSYLSFANIIRTQKILTWDDTEITCLVPLGLQSGCLSVSTNSGKSNCVPYKAIQPLPWLILLLSTK